MILNFKEKSDNKITLIKSALYIPTVTRFRYCELEVLENKADCSVFFGIVEAKDKFENEVENINLLNGQQT